MVGYALPTSLRSASERSNAGHRPLGAIASVPIAIYSAKLCYTESTEVFVLPHQPWREKPDAALQRVHEGSDLDLLIMKDTNQPFLDRIAEVLSTVDVDVPVEPIVYTPTEIDRLCEERRDFIVTILEEAKLLYDAGRQH